jgi:hypothetical protein
MSWFSRFMNVVRRDRLTRDLDDEIRFHVASRAEELTRAGMSPEQAKKQAGRQLGNPLLLRESSRDIKLFPRLESILLDVAFGLRICRKSAIVTAAAVVSSALGKNDPPMLVRSDPPWDQDLKQAQSPPRTRAHAIVRGIAVLERN